MNIKQEPIDLEESTTGELQFLQTVPHPIYKAKFLGHFTLHISLHIQFLETVPHSIYNNANFLFPNSIYNAKIAYNAKFLAAMKKNQTKLGAATHWKIGYFVTH
jgi:hypothetical protein